MKEINLRCKGNGKRCLNCNLRFSDCFDSEKVPFPSFCSFSNRSCSWQVSNSNALNKQIAGNHYKDYKIQPIEFIVANKIPFIEANIIKYLCRHRKKNGIEDLKKAMHYLELLAWFEYGKSLKEEDNE